MKAVVQRVSHARVKVDHKIVGEIHRGLLVLLAVHKEDTEDDLTWIVEKICNLRIFPNQEGKFDQSLLEIHGQALIVSQFTLYGDCRKGRRPDFTQSAPPEKANNLYLCAIEKFRQMGLNTQAGEFGAMMDVELVNDGPVTLIIDSPRKY